MDIFTNNRVTLTDDPELGVCVLTDQGFMPINTLPTESLAKVRELLDFSPACPSPIFDAVYGLEVLEPMKEATDAHLVY